MAPAGPDYIFFNFGSRTIDCVNPPPPESKKDKCRVEITDGAVQPEQTYLVERRGDRFFAPAPELFRINRIYPTWRAPERELKDYLIARAAFFQTFGDGSRPTEFSRSIHIPADLEDSSVEEILEGYINHVSNFLAIGVFDPQSKSQRELLIHAITSPLYSFADPKVGPKFTEILGRLKDDPSLSLRARIKVEWLLAIQESWDKLWTHLKPASDMATEALAKQMKRAATWIMIFLYADPILKEGGEAAVFEDPERRVVEAGKLFFDEMSKKDVDRQRFGDYYDYMRRAIHHMKTPNLPPENQEKFNQRLAILDDKFSEASRKDYAYLANQSPQKAFKESLRRNYGDTPERSRALEVMLRNLEVKDIGGRPHFEINIAEISREWRAMANVQPLSEARKTTVAAINYLLKQLFEKNGRIGVFWKTHDFQMVNFYPSVKRVLLSEDGKLLDELVQWARRQAVEEDLILAPGVVPHGPMRKWTLITEAGITGMGAAGLIGFHFAENPYAKYYGQGVSLVLASSALGSVGGNILSYFADAPSEQAWWFDLGGALIGGLISGLLYGLATSPPPTMGLPIPPPPPPPPPKIDPGARFPSDPFGP